MQTFQQQLAFFDSQRAGLRAALTAGGPAAAVAFLGSFSDETERRVMFAFARQELVQREGESKEFDAAIAVADAGIAEMLSQARVAADEETKARRTWSAQVISFNLAADLAECWPGDNAPRTKAQLERGLQAAQNCIVLCKQLGKGPAEFSSAYWVQGMHQLSLGRPEAAQASWQTAYDYACQAQQAEGRAIAVSASADWSILLMSGYLALGQLAAGEQRGRALYTQVLGALHSQLDDETTKDDAQFCIDQLEEVQRRFVETQHAAS